MMSDSIPQVKTAQEYLDEYNLLRPHEGRSGQALVDYRTGEIKTWNISDERKYEFNASMKQIYTSCTGGLRADLANISNAYKAQEHLLDIALENLKDERDIEFDHIQETAIRQAEELISRNIDFRKLCVAIGNEFGGMVEALKFFLQKELSNYKSTNPDLGKLERKMGKILVVPVKRKDFPVFEHIDKDIREADEQIRLTQQRVLEIKAMAEEEGENNEL